MAKSSLLFTSISMENWRNFRDVTANLERRSFIIGPNASGKSNFLDAFRFLRDIVSVGGGLQEAVRSRGGISAIRCLAARKTPQIAIKVNIGDFGGDKWQYEIAFDGKGNNDKVIIKHERVVKDGQVILERPNSEDYHDEERLTQTALEQVNVNKEFREVAEFLSTVRYLHIVPQLVREPDRSVGRLNDPFGGDFLEQIAHLHEKTRAARLSKISEILKAAVPQLLELELKRDNRGVPHLRARYEHWRPKGAWQNESQLSDGTLRLFGLLWALLDGDSPLLLEEPELSLHPDVVRYIPQMTAKLLRGKKRQIFISTHSVELLYDRGIGLDEILLLVPDQEGTLIQSPTSIPQVKSLVKGDISIAEAVLPYTRPKKAEQLMLFGDN